MHSHLFLFSEVLDERWANLSCGSLARRDCCRSALHLQSSFDSVQKSPQAPTNRATPHRIHHTSPSQDTLLEESSKLSTAKGSKSKRARAQTKQTFASTTEGTPDGIQAPQDQPVFDTDAHESCGKEPGKLSTDDGGGDETGVEKEREQEQGADGGDGGVGSVNGGEGAAEGIPPGAGGSTTRGEMD